MRLSLVSALILFALPALAARPVSGVVAVSTGPMTAYMEVETDKRNLAIGDDVLLMDTVETSTRTKAQVLLRDESVFSLAPKSKVVFDEFVYDPGVDNKLVARVAGGAVRFISGKIADEDNQDVQIKAGRATVGIRGTEIIAAHNDGKSTFVLMSGEIDVTTDSGRITLDRAGWGIDVAADGALGVPRRVPIAELIALTAPPPEENDEGDDSEAEGEGDESGEETASEESESEDSAEADADAQAEPDAQAEADTTSDGDSGGDSSFDAALSGGGIDDAEPLAAVSVAAPVIAPEPIAVDVSASLDAVVENVSLDRQATEAASNAGPQLLLTQNTINTRPFYASDAKILVREGRRWDEAYYDVLRDLMAAKFPTAQNSDTTLPTYDGFNYVHRVDTAVNDGTNLVQAEVDLANYDAVLLVGSTQGAAPTYDVNGQVTGSDYHVNGELTANEISLLSNFAQGAGQVTVMSRSGSSMVDEIESYLDVFSTTVAFNSLTGTNDLTMQPSQSDAALTFGVTSLVHDYNGSFEQLAFSGATTAQNLLDDGNGGASQAALTFGDSGNIYVTRHVCGSDGSGVYGIEAMSHDATTFCSNLISAMAPADSFRAVEVGRLSISGETDVSYELLSDGSGYFTILGDRLLLAGGTQPTAGTYEITVGVTIGDAQQVSTTQTVTVTEAARESHIIASSSTHNIDAPVTLPDALGGTLKTELPSWVSISTQSGTPTLGGAIRLHYEHTVDGTVYDRYHDLVVNTGCTSDHCDAFLDSLDTKTPLTEGRHFSLDAHQADFDAFYGSFGSGTGTFRGREILSVANAYDLDSHLEVTVNYGARTTDMTSRGSFSVDTVNRGIITGSWTTQYTGMDFSATHGSCTGTGALCSYDSASLTGGVSSMTCTGTSGLCTTQNHNNVDIKPVVELTPMPLQGHGDSESYALIAGHKINDANAYVTNSPTTPINDGAVRTALTPR